jgi:LysM repeat protein
MKILQIFGAVAALHLLAFIFIFASPGCQSSPSNVPTPDATLPGGEAPAVAYSAPAEVSMPMPVDTSASTVAASDTGHAVPTRPGSPNAVAITPASAPVENVAPVSTYTVHKGESLWTIAKKHHLTVAELAKANNLGTNATLQPGKKLIIPGKVAPAPAPAAPVATTLVAPTADTKAASSHTSGEIVRHTVTTGETLSTIAHKYGVSSGDLAVANSITDPAKIRVGQTLIIPNAKPGTVKANGKASTKPAAATASAADKPAAPAASSPVAATPPVDQTPHFELKAPPPGQDLDAGLKDTSGTEVPTVKVDEPKTDETPKN